MDLKSYSVKWIEFLGLFFILFVLERVYFRLASGFGIMDIPNERSSHHRQTIRGGGIIIPFALFFSVVFPGDQYSFFLLGLVLISLVSFMDDLKGLPSWLRLIGYACSMGLLFYQIVGAAYLEVEYLLLFIVALGIVNTYNFMDGINGITVAYSLSVLAAMLYIDIFMINILPEGLLISFLLALIVFGFFNFRKNAVCFAGDIGSVSAGFIIVYMLGSLVYLTGNFIWILLLAVYGVDSVLTIVHRLIRKENIFKAHRSHLYQYMVNSLKMGHLKVALLYALVQGVISMVVIMNRNIPYLPDWLLASMILAFLGITYISLKFYIIRIYKSIPGS